MIIKCKCGQEIKLKTDWVHDCDEEEESVKEKLKDKMWTFEYLRGKKVKNIYLGNKEYVSLYKEQTGIYITASELGFQSTNTYKGIDVYKIPVDSHLEVS